MTEPVIPGPLAIPETGAYVSAPDGARELVERRSSPRRPYQLQVELAPLDPHGEASEQRPRYRAVARNLSEDGINMLCTRLVPHTRIVVYLRDADGRVTRREADIVRLQTTDTHLYEIAARFRPHRS